MLWVHLGIAQFLLRNFSSFYPISTKIYGTHGGLENMTKIKDKTYTINTYTIK